MKGLQVSNQAFSKLPILSNYTRGLADLHANYGQWPPFSKAPCFCGERATARWGVLARSIERPIDAKRMKRQIGSSKRGVILRGDINE